MDLEVKDVAELLSVSETTIRHWIVEGQIPSYRLNRQYRFSRVEIEDWVMRHHIEQFRIKDKQNLPEEGVKGIQQFSLYRAIHHGGVYSSIAGSSKEAIIRGATTALEPRLKWDAEVVADLLLDREKMMSTSLGHGFAIPHTRDYILKGASDVVTVVFPEKPLDWDSLDGEKVHTLFFLFASNDKNHLHLLAKIAHLCTQPGFPLEMAQKPSKERLLELIKSAEEQMRH